MKILEKVQKDLDAVIERQHAIVDFIIDSKDASKEFLKLRKDVEFLKNAENVILYGYDKHYLTSELHRLLGEKKVPSKIKRIKFLRYLLE